MNGNVHPMDESMDIICLLNEAFATMDQPMENMNLRQDHIPLRAEHLENDEGFDRGHVRHGTKRDVAYE
jgi:molybdopterin-biosynthesis enzyme MoeA-like protein